MTDYELRIRAAIVIGVHQHERHFRLADDFAVDFANAFGLADFAARLGQFDFDDQRLARAHRLAPFHVFGRHEIGEFAGVFGAFEHQDARDLRDGFQVAARPA